MKRKIGSFSLMKRMNTAVILNVIREKGPISRIKLAEETGLTAATITNITAELIENKLVIEFSTGVSTGGRKPIMLKINSEAIYIASAYISPDKVEFAVSNFSADIVFYKHKKIDSKISPDQCVDFIVNSLNAFTQKSEKKIIGMGVGLHGIVDSEEGTIINAPNLKWKNVNIRKLLIEKTDIPVMADNDVRLMALAEMWFGRARSNKNFVLLYVGRGVGSAVVIDGVLLRGFSESAGEIGHCIIDPQGPVCECGKRGCLQAFTNESAMLSALIKNIDKTDCLNADSDCSDIVDAYLNHNDKVASKIIEEEIKYLKYGISTIINMINPALIVINTNIKDFDIATINELSECARKSPYDDERDICTIKFSNLGKRSVLKGAICMILTKIYENPRSVWEENLFD